MLSIVDQVGDLVSLSKLPHVYPVFGFVKVLEILRVISDHVHEGVEVYRIAYRKVFRNSRKSAGFVGKQRHVSEHVVVYLITRIFRNSLKQFFTVNFSAFLAFSKNIDFALSYDKKVIFLNDFLVRRNYIFFQFIG